ncbi:TPA: hypothetical protein OCQ66_004759, partial [Escherichia coli]|nr:hypothetical protein [Escherichia coli]
SFSSRVLIAFSKFCLLASFGESHPASKNELKATKITTTFFDLIIIFPLYQTIKFLASAAGCSVPSICRRKLVCDGITKVTPTEPAAGTGKNIVIDCTICGTVPGYKIVAAYVQISLLKDSFVFDHQANV